LYRYDVELFAPKRGTNLGWHRDGYQPGTFIAHVLAAATTAGVGDDDELATGQDEYEEVEEEEEGDGDAPWFDHGRGQGGWWFWLNPL
jgi:hypothetical protein